MECRNLGQKILGKLCRRWLSDIQVAAWRLSGPAVGEGEGRLDVEARRRSLEGHALGPILFVVADDQLAGIVSDALQSKAGIAVRSEQGRRSDMIALTAFMWPGMSN